MSVERFQQPAYEKAGLTLSDYKRLPHPGRQRVKLLPYLDGTSKHPVMSDLIEALKMPYQGIDSAVAILAGERKFRELARMEGTDIVALLRGLAVPMKQLIDEGRLFVISDELSGLLFQTDVADDVPSSLLCLPFRTCYFHFAAPLADCPLVEPSGPRSMVGVYAQEFRARPVEFEHEKLAEGETPRSILLTFVGDGLPEDPDDDVLRYLTLDLSKPDVPLSEVLEKTFSMMARNSGAATATKLDANYWNSLRTALHYVVRVLLYTACAGVRQDVRKPATELDAQIARTGPGKRAKLERKRARVYDYIEICPPTKTDAVGQSSSGTMSRTAHWRRGHIRNQPHGPQNKLRKLIFIAPLLVSGSVAASPDAKEYRVS